MKKKYFIIVIILFLFFANVSFASEEDVFSQDGKIILNEFKCYEAIKSKDLKKLDDLFCSDIVLTNETGTLNKLEFFEALKDIELKEYRIKYLKIKTYNDSAILNYTVGTIFVQDHKEYMSVGFCTSIWEKFGENWKLAAYHKSRAKVVRLDEIDKPAN